MKFRVTIALLLASTGAFIAGPRASLAAHQTIEPSAGPSTRPSAHGAVRYTMRMYAFDARALPTAQSSPLVLADGVIGRSVILINDALAAFPASALTPVPPSTTSTPPTTPRTPPATPLPANPAPATAAPKPPAAADPAAQPPLPPARKAEPTLDELLGLSKPAGASNATAAEPAPATDNQSRKELDRLLTAQEMGDAFKQAVTLMGDAAGRLDTRKDAGLETQRIQEEVIRKLDQLLSSLDQQQQQQQQQSKPQPSESQSKSQPRAKPQQNQQQQQSDASSSDPKEGERPTLKTGPLKPGLESARAAWGALPERIREMLMQGTEDRFSSRYKTMTEEYYKRLAEERSR